MIILSGIIIGDDECTSIVIIICISDSGVEITLAVFYFDVGLIDIGIENDDIRVETR